MLELKMKKQTGLLLASAALLTAFGCESTRDSAMPSKPSSTARMPDAPEPMAPAGVPVTGAGTEIDTVMAHAEAMNVAVRPRSFALTAAEFSFDRSQTSERLISEHGFFPEFQPSQPPADPPLRRGPIPRWRLSGVLVSNGTVALLERETETNEIYPGMIIPNSEWRVKSIDEEKAVLERLTDADPKEIEVRLESQPLSGTPSGNTGGAGSGVGAPAGGTGGPSLGGSDGGGGQSAGF
jgi:hypothetical protein